MNKKTIRKAEKVRVQLDAQMKLAKSFLITDLEYSKYVNNQFSALELQKFEEKQDSKFSALDRAENLNSRYVNLAESIAAQAVMEGRICALADDENRSPGCYECLYCQFQRAANIRSAQSGYLHLQVS